MNKKIGFSNIGGVYIEENIQTKTHIHQAITVIISFKDNFDCFIEQKQISSSGIVIQPNTIRQFNSPENNSIAFIHIEPFSEQGLKLIDRDIPFTELSKSQTENIIMFIKKWALHKGNQEKLTEELINSTIKEIKPTTNNLTIDKRIKKVIDIIQKTENTSLKSISKTVNLSTFRLSHLFKQETGITLKKFVLHTKLVKSIKAIYQNQNLTQSAYSGNFADQAHFTRTYKNSFGVLPSKL
ncbi:Helix-turn-helix domain-containing protein [Tenacibaculum sp. MAR_2009_124]|uniref:helix-turn-helix transcriptional regulator n=1 Tax=Tenacibaculum sp. MAR_2009_124 TaxID=1250059 RepID=UPI00089467A4|nr:helix-turn-helix transcriptional regulator [Tenacibaculum sp. MAR_2009_124]SEC77846.1 Helix-turn-helix domain-containing protein [Tenacibaculum sp. MAR_2009_124]